MCSYFSKYNVLAISAVMVLLITSARSDYSSPWAPMVNDSWIVTTPIDASVNPRMYAANSAVEYKLLFNMKNKKGNASGMKSIKFNSTTGRQSGGQSGSFQITASGDVDFGAVLVLVAIDADSLAGDFSFTMNGDTYNPTDHFAYYDPSALGYDTGRPTGYYSGVSPTSAPLSYKFTEGMVSLLAIEGITFDLNNPVDVNYSFANLPGTAVFSVYAVPNDMGGLLVPDDIHHTNNPLGSSVSSFEVIPEPGSLAILACASVMMLKRRRRKEL